MKKTFIAVGVASLLGLTSVAQAADFNWYGSIRAGITNADDGTNKTTAIADNRSSRIGIKASSDLGNGQSVGGQVEFAIDDGKNPFNSRRRNVWINGGWGKLTIGKQGGIYRSAANWDQSNYLGGNVRYGGDVDGAEGIAYESNLAGPFSFNIEVAGEDGIEQWAATAHYDFGVATLNVGHHDDKRETNFGVLTPQAIDIDSFYFDNTVVSVNGSVSGFDWNLAYEQSKLNADDKNAAISATIASFGVKAKTIGAFASYDVTENDKLYAEYENGKLNTTDPTRTAVVVGYSHNFGGGLNFSGEYRTSKNVKHVLGDKDKTLALVFKYNF